MRYRNRPSWINAKPGNSNWSWVRWGCIAFASWIILFGQGTERVGQLWAAPATFFQDESLTDQQLEFFETKIRPLLIEHCFECHSEQSEGVGGGLYLDSRAGLLEGGDSGPAIDLDNVAESILLNAVNYGGLFEMPPSSKLPQAEIDSLRRWLEMGAPWPKSTDSRETNRKHFDIERLKSEHWCWHPPKPPSIPDVPNADWQRQQIDRFIFAKLMEHQLSPQTLADRAILLRRAYFDLIGLPPSPAQVQAFVENPDPAAFGQVIDELLASPHFGERWARHWMDLVRYAETYGHEFDYPIENAYQYRDYLIRAFNANVPYDQFVLEHLAGDLLEHPRRRPDDLVNESVLGTGFWFLGEAVHAPVDVRADQAGRIDNQIDVLGKTFLGLTIACARCHDHKFDAISIADYYAVAGFLLSSHRDEVLLDPQQTIERATGEMRAGVAQADRLAAETLAAFEQLETASLSRPIAAVLVAAERLPHRFLDSATDAARESAEEPAALEEVASRFGFDVALLERWIEATLADETNAVSHPLHLIRLVAKERAKERTQPASLAFNQRIMAIQQQLEAQFLAAEQSRASGIQFADFSPLNLLAWYKTGFAFEHQGGTEATIEIAGNELIALPHTAHSGRLGRRQQGVLRSPTFVIKHEQIHYRLRSRDVQIRLVIDGFDMNRFNALLFEGMSFRCDTEGAVIWQTQAGDLKNHLGQRAHIEIVDHGEGWCAIDEIWFSNDAAPLERPSPIGVAVLAGMPKSQPPTHESLAQAWANELIRGAKTDWREEAQLRTINWLARYSLSPVELQERIAGLIQFKARLVDQQAKIPAPVRALGITDGSGVNESLFIRGNHRNLGAEVPRNLLTALRSSPTLSPAPVRGSGRLQLAQQLIDPANPLTARVLVNRLWHHLMGRGIVTSVDNFGVMGELPTHPELLDYLALEFMGNGWQIKPLLKQIMLSRTYQLSSSLNQANHQIDPANRWYHRGPVRRLEGESIRDAMLTISGDLRPDMFGLSVPVHLTPFMQGRGRPGTSGPLNGMGRRTVYQEVRRNFLAPMMLAFDTPIPFNSMGRRTESNVPAQALILLNSPFVLDQARKWAEKSIQAEPHTRSRIERLYVEAFARRPDPSELELAEAFLQTQANELQLDPQSREAEIQIWTDYCHILFNVKEFIFLK